MWESWTPATGRPDWSSIEPSASYERGTPVGCLAGSSPRCPEGRMPSTFSKNPKGYRSTSGGRAPLGRSRHTQVSCASKVSLRRIKVHCTCGLISPDVTVSDHSGHPTLGCIPRRCPEGRMARTFSNNLEESRRSRRPSCGSRGRRRPSGQTGRASTPPRTPPSTSATTRTVSIWAPRRPQGARV